VEKLDKMTQEKENSISSKSTSTLNLQYVMKKVIVDKEIIKKFVLDKDNRRKLRNGKIKELLKELNERVHFNSAFVVNEKSNHYFLIDGNHRYEAIKLKIAQDPKFSIAVWIAVYRNLTKEKEREVYKLWNIGITQSATDFLKLYFKTIPFGQEMLQRLPVTIYGDKMNLGIKLLVGSHICAKRQKKFEGGYGAGKEQTVGDFSEIDSEDIDTMKEFTDFMKETFGEYDKDNNNLFYKSTPLCAFYRIWYDNNSISKKLVKLFRKVYLRKIDLWKSQMNVGGRVACINFYDTSITHLNRFAKIKSDKDLVPIKDKEREIIALVKNNK